MLYSRRTTTYQLLVWEYPFLKINPDLKAIGARNIQAPALFKMIARVSNKNADWSVS